jgi:putative aldouronate transport system permease protein
MVGNMKKTSGFTIFNYTLLFLITLIMLVPVLNIVAMSLSDPARVSQLSGIDIIPKGFSLINYKVLFLNPLILKSIFNSVFITVTGTILNLLFTAMAAYVLTRPKLPGKNIFMVMTIIVMVFEPGLIQQYLLIKKLGLIDSYLSIIIFGAVNVYYLIILMRAFEEVPETLIEAAKIDGANEFTIFSKVMLPLSKAMLATLGLFYAVAHWNEYFKASIFLNSSSKWPLQVLLRQFVVVGDTSSMIGLNSLFAYDKAAQLNYKALQAGTIVIAIVPILMLYPIILKFYTKGTMEGGVKE